LIIYKLFVINIQVLTRSRPSVTNMWHGSVFRWTDVTYMWHGEYRFIWDWFSPVYFNKYQLSVVYSNKFFFTTGSNFGNHIVIICIILNRVYVKIHFIRSFFKEHFDLHSIVNVLKIFQILTFWRPVMFSWLYTFLPPKFFLDFILFYLIHGYLTYGLYKNL